MCFITRKIFACCGSENWYSTPIPQQCTGTPRCSSGDCIILRPFAEVVEDKKCWRCILEDAKKGVRVNDIVLREATRIAQENSWGEFDKGEKRGKFMAEPVGVVKRKRGREEKETAMGEPRFKGAKGGYGNGNRYGQRGAGKSNIEMPPPPLPYMPVEKLKGPVESSHPWTNRRGNPALVKQTQTRAPIQASSAPYEDVSTKSFLQYGSASNFLPSNVAASLEYNNSELNNSPQPDLTINPIQLTNWQDLVEWDKLLSGNLETSILLSDGTAIEMPNDQRAAADRQNDESLTNPGIPYQTSIQDQQLSSLLAEPSNFDQDLGQGNFSWLDSFDDQKAFEEFEDFWPPMTSSLDQNLAFDEEPFSSLAITHHPEQNTAPNQQATLTQTVSTLAMENQPERNASNQGVTKPWIPTPKEIDQTPAFSQSSASASMLGTQSYPMTTQWPNLWTAQRMLNQSVQTVSSLGNLDSIQTQEPHTPADSKISGTTNLASTPLGDSMQFQSSLDDQAFKEQWPEFVTPEDRSNLVASTLDEESRLELEAILFGSKG